MSSHYQNGSPQRGGMRQCKDALQILFHTHSKLLEIISGVFSNFRKILKLLLRIPLYPEFISSQILFSWKYLYTLDQKLFLRVHSWCISAQPRITCPDALYAEVGQSEFEIRCHVTGYITDFQMYWEDDEEYDITGHIMAEGQEVVR